MAEPIGSLYASLGLDSAQFDTGMAKARSEIKAFGKLDIGKGMKSGLGELESGFKSTAGRAGVLGAALSGMGLAGVAAGAALVGVGLAAGRARQAFAFADDIADTASRLAVSTTRLQEYRFAVHQLGGDYEDADKALEGFSKAFGAAHAGLTKRAAKPFEALGLDAKSFLTTEEALDAVVEKISLLASTAEQAAIADKLGLGAMLPALRAGASAIDEAREAAHRLGFVMDDALVQKGGAANDRMEDLEKVLSVQLHSAMVDLAPIILSVAGALAESARATSDFVSWLSKLNEWSASNDLMAMFRWAENAGKATGKFLGTDQYGPAMRGLVGGPKPLTATSEGIRKLLAGGTQGLGPRTGALIAPSAGGGGKDRSGQVAQASAAAIASAERDELAARMALTGNIWTLAALREQEVSAEAARETARLARDAAEGKITQAAAEAAIAMNRRAEADRLALIQREAEAALERQTLDQRRLIFGFYDDIARSQAQMAATAAERNAIEKQALAHQQRLETERLRADLDEQVLREEIGESFRTAALAAQADAQAQERRAAAALAQERLAAEASARAQGALMLQGDLLASQRDLATTAAGRLDIDLDLLDLAHELERVRQQEVIDSTKAGSVEREIAEARMALLGVIQKNQKTAAFRVEDAFNLTSDAITDMADAFRNRDWAGVLSGLVSSIQALAVAFGPNGTIASKVGAVAGIAGAAGNLIGGTAGSALSGAASGAMAGFTIAGPAGAIVGGLIGGISSLFGSSKAKKREKAEAAARKAQEEAARLQAILNERRDLENQLLALTAGSAAALTAQRAAELAAMDASNRALQEQVWAAELAADRHRLDIELMEAVGDATGALTARRADELKALDASLHGVQQAIWAAEDLKAANLAAAAAQKEARTGAVGLIEDARNALIAGYEREAGAIKTTITRLKDYAASLREFRLSLTADQFAAGGSSATLAAEFRQIAARARLGDEQAQAKLIGAGEKARDASASSAKTLLEHLRTLAGIRTEVAAAEDTALRQASIAEQQLASLDAMTSGLLGLREDQRTVPMLLAAMRAALANYTGVTGQKLGANPAANAELAVTTGYGGDFGTGGFQAWIVEQDEATKAKARQILLRYGTPERVAFAGGGQFTVGGASGIDTQAFGPISLTQGEVVNVSKGDSIAALALEVRQLRADQRIASAELAKNTAATARFLQRWEGGGLPPERVAA